MTTSNTDPLVGLLGNTLERSDILGFPPPIRGKVRDIYDLNDRLLIVTTDRLSAFDVVLGTIPCKGQVLNTIAAFWFNKTADLILNHMISVPDPCAMVVKKLLPLPVEVVVRRFITGSLWREYEQGHEEAYGIRFKKGLRKDERFSEPILTPTTKAEVGKHDAPVSPEQLVQSGSVSADIWQQIEIAARVLFAYGEDEAARRGLLLVDTKYEFGLDGEKLVLMDEVHTPDSSRYWESQNYHAHFSKGEPQEMLDKENIRQWLLERGFSGDGTPPPLNDEIRVNLSRTYLGLQKRLTGLGTRLPFGNVSERLQTNLRIAGLLPG
jgi:phosphoribosylaminoimidazole-succinocarboxamide synthase